MLLESEGNDAPMPLQRDQNETHVTEGRLQTRIAQSL